MSFTFNCNYCGQPITAKREWAGKNLPCPACKKTITVPGSEKTSPSITPHVQPVATAVVKPKAISKPTKKRRWPLILIIFALLGILGYYLDEKKSAQIAIAQATKLAEMHLINATKNNNHILHKATVVKVYPLTRNKKQPDIPKTNYYTMEADISFANSPYYELLPNSSTPIKLTFDIITFSDSDDDLCAAAVLRNDFSSNELARQSFILTCSPYIKTLLDISGGVITNIEIRSRSEKDAVVRLHLNFPKEKDRGWVDAKFSQSPSFEGAEIKKTPVNTLDASDNIK